MREQPWDNLTERGGTPFTKAHDPEGNWDTIDTAITSKDKVITSLGSAVDADGDYAARSTTNYIDSNSDIDEDLTDLDTQLKATQDEVDAVEGALGAMVSSAGAYVAHAGTNYIDGNADTTEDLTDLDTQIKTNADGIADVIDGTTARTGTIQNTTNVGTAGTNVTAVEHGDGVQHTTVLTLTNVDLGAIPGAGNLAVGALIYTFPAGAHLHKVTYHSVSLTGDAAIQADTADLGIGSVVASGAVAVLGGDPTFEDYVTGSATADCNGTDLVVGPVGATAGILTDISLNATGSTKTVYLNAACGWAGASVALLANGTVSFEWTTLA